MHGNPWMLCRELFVFLRMNGTQNLVFGLQTVCDLKLRHEAHGDTAPYVRSPDLVEV